MRVIIVPSEAEGLYWDGSAQGMAADVPFQTPRDTRSAAAVSGETSASITSAAAKERHQDDNQKDQAGVGPRARKNQRLAASVAAR